MSTSSARASGTTWRIDRAKCTGCGDCMLICPAGVIRLKKKVALLGDEAACCRETCRICERQCPEQAIRSF